MKRAAIKGRFAIGRRGGFHARDDNGRTVINVRGRVGDERASGSFRYRGSVFGSDGVERSCDSGLLPWRSKLTGAPVIGP
jgi:hypothetical protein